MILTFGRRGSLAALALHALVALTYFWFATAATLQVQPGGHFYELLGDAFLAGQLHLPVTPNPELLALPDPYDPGQNEPYRLQDASLYEGRYYLYWGPVPGLAHALWKGLTGQPASTMLLQVLLGVGGYLCFRLLARALRDLAFPCVPDWSVELVALCYALGGVGPYLQGRAIIHHEAFLWASLFLLAGFYWWVRGLAEERGSLRHLALAGLLFGGAFGSRTTLVSYAAAAGLVLAVAIDVRRSLRPSATSTWLRAPSDRRALRQLIAFWVPSTAVLGLLALYNQARFDSPFEFGQAYQLAGYLQDPKWSLAFVPYNLAAYLVLVPTFILFFPFQYSPRPAEWFAADVWSLEHPISSILVIAPLVILAPLAIRRAPATPPAARAFAIAGGFGTLGTFALLLLWSSASGRYLQDVLPVLGLLGALGLWRLQPRPLARPSLRLAHGSLSALILVGSLAAGLSYGLTHLSVAHHDEYARLAYRFDSAAARVVLRVRPEIWQQTYVTPQVRDRPGGFFYLGESPVVVAVRPDEPIQALTVESFFPGERRVEVEIDGRTVSEEVIGEGPQHLRLDRDVMPSPSGRATLRLTLAEDDPALNERLWPLRVVALGPLEPDP